MKWLISGDLHARQTAPRCRIDPDWIASQRKNLEKIRDTAVDLHCTFVVLTGDLFHVAKATNELVNLYLEVFTDFANEILNPVLFILPGNHDLLYNSIQYIEQTAVGTLLKTYNGVVELSEFPYKFIHTLCFPSDKERPVKGIGITAQELLDANRDCRGIFTGDYHRSFFYKAPDGRFVLNPGCLNIQAADMIDYIPKIAIFDTITEEVEWVQVEENPLEFVDTNYLDQKKVKEDSMGKFIEVIQSNQGITLDFVSNLQQRVQDTTLGDNTRKLLETILVQL